MQRGIAWRARVGPIAVFACAITGAFAQAGQTDVGEISGFGGFTLGTGGTHAAVGGGAGIAVSRYGMMLFETSFMPLGHSTIQGWPAQSAVTRSHLWDFALDSHIRVPIKDRWEPYVILGTGILWNVVRQQAVNANGAAVTYNLDQFNGVFHTGAGLRYYVGRSWGIRPEVKVIVTQRTYTRLSIGIFYVTPPEWP
jgi:hypothetical protein